MYAKATLIGVAGLFLLNAPARGSVVEVDPFVGAMSETWEPFKPGFEGFPRLPDPSAIMGGSAMISNPNMTVFQPSISVFSLGTSGSAQPSDGVKAMGLDGFAQTAIIDFDVPLIRFGAYWGAGTNAMAGDPALVTVTFFDESELLIGTEVFTYSHSEQADGVLDWHGWSSTVPIKRLAYSEDFVVVDGLQADPVPEPATGLLILGIALPALLFRRLSNVTKGVLYGRHSSSQAFSRGSIAFDTAVAHDHRRSSCGGPGEN